jgi:hypothetical protein
MIPYVKGFHLTAEMWRGNRDEDGWKLPTTGDKTRLIDEEDEDNATLSHMTHFRFYYSSTSVDS